MFWEKKEEPYEPIVQIQNGFVPGLYVCGLNTPECSHLLINKEVFTIGSGSDNDGVMDFPMLGLSRKHCQIECKDGKFTVEDCNSMNGTYVNGKRLLPGVKTPIKGGDQMRLGMCVLSVDEIIQEEL